MANRSSFTSKDTLIIEYSTWFVIEGKDYGYFDPKKTGHPVIFAFYNPYGNPFTSETWDAAHIYKVRDSYFVTTSQRLGKKFY